MEADFARNPDWLPALDVAAACGTSEVHEEAPVAYLKSQLLPSEAAANNLSGCYISFP